MSVTVGQIGLNMVLNGNQFKSQLNNLQSKAQLASNKMSGSFKRLGIVIAAAFSVAKIKKFGQESIKLANEQTQAEVKLQTIMKQRMKATDAAVKKIKDYAGAQQKIGVIGDEVQLAGAQQLSTFLNTDKALKTLIPAMNNLAVQQNGVNAGASDLVNIGNLMGKAMQGQTSALTRVGITFTEAQEKVLKYGNEQERAAMLAQVITDNVGDMNRAIAATPAGKLQQIKNTWGDIKETVGRGLNNTFKPLLNLINKIIQRLAVLSSAFEKFTAGLFGDANDTLSSLATTANDIGAVGDEADASAESIDSITESAEKAERSLAGFDKLNVLSKPDTSAQYDTPKVSATESPINKTTNSAVKKLSDVISGIWDSKSQKLINSIKNALSSIKIAIGSIKTAWKNVWNNGSGKKLLNNIKSLLTHIFENIGYIAKAFNNAWNKAGRGEGVVQSIIDKANSLIELIDTIAQDFKEVWNNGTGERIWGNILEIIKNCNFYTAKFREKIKKAWEKNDTGKKLWQDILGIIEDITGWLKDMSEINLDWIENLDLSPLAESVESLALAFRGLLKACGQKLKDVYKQVLLPLAKWTIEKGLPKLIEGLAKAFELLAKFIKKIPVPVLAGIASGIGVIIAAFKGFEIARKIKEHFETIKIAFAGLKNVLKSHKYAAAITAIVAAVTALATAVSLYNKQKWENSSMAGLVDRLGEAKNSFDEVKESATSSVKSVNDSLSGLSGEFNTLDTAKNKLEELLDKGTLDQSEVAEVKTLLDVIKSKVPEFDLACSDLMKIDDESGQGHVKKNADEAVKSIENVIDAYKRQAAQAALTSAITETQSQLFTATQKQDAANNVVAGLKSQRERQYKNALSTYGVSQDEYEAYIKYMQGDLSQYGKFATNDISQINYQKVKSAMNKIDKAIGEAEISASSASIAVSELNDTYSHSEKMLNVLNGDYSDYSAVLDAYSSKMITEQDVMDNTGQSVSQLSYLVSKLPQYTFESGSAVSSSFNNMKSTLDNANIDWEKYGDKTAFTMGGVEYTLNDLKNLSEEDFKAMSDYFNTSDWTSWGTEATNAGGLVTDAYNTATDNTKQFNEDTQENLYAINTGYQSTFSKIKNAAQDFWSNLKRIFSGSVSLKEGLKGVFKEVLNWMIDGINDMISTLVEHINDGLSNIKDWEILGVKPFSWVPTFNAPQIPKLAKGAVVKAPTLAVVGDNPGASTGDPEVVAPLSKLEQMWTNKSGDNTGGDQGLLNMLTRIYELLVLFRRESSNKDDTPVVNVDGKTLFEIMVKQDSDYRNRHGGYSPLGG